MSSFVVTNKSQSNEIIRLWSWAKAAPILSCRAGST